MYKRERERERAGGHEGRRAGGEMNNETKTRELRKIFALFGAFQLYKHIGGYMLIRLCSLTVSSHVVSSRVVFLSEDFSLQNLPFANVLLCIILF